MCDCIKEVSKAALAHAEEQLNTSIDERMLPLEEEWNHGIQNVGFSMSRSENGVHIIGGLRLKTNIVFRTDFKKKDGTRSKPRNSNMSLAFTYCPFCGVAYEPKEEPAVQECDATAAQ